MSEPKDHHFVPIFYLQRWAAVDGKLVVYARKGGRIVFARRNPRSTGFERELYSLAGVVDSERQRVEKEFFSRMIDNPAAIVVEKLIQQCGGGIALDEMVVFSHFIMSLRARHPSAVQKAREEGPAELRRHLDRNPEEYERLRAPEDPATLREAAEKYLPLRVQNFGLNVLQLTILSPKVGERLFKSHWWVVRFTGDDRPLLTSDRPCILEGNLVDGEFLVALPLSPTSLFFACSDATKVEQLQKLPGDALIDRINRASAVGAAKYVYGTDDRYLRLVDDLLGQGTG